MPGEALASWLLRYAEPFGLAPEDLLLRTTEAELAGRGDWCRRPHSALIERLAQATGIDPTTIADMTLWSGDQASDDMRDRFSWLRFQAALPANGQRRRIAVCPLCLAEDETPCVRRAPSAPMKMIFGIVPPSSVPTDRQRHRAAEHPAPN